MTALDDAILADAAIRSPGGVWRAESGPLLAAACLHATDADKGSALPSAAVGGFRRMILEHQADGFIGPDGLVSGMFFACNLGQAQQVLRPLSVLTAAEDTRWTTALTTIAQKLADNGDLIWYANGNIVLGNALVMALAWKATGDTAWRDRYEAAFEHALRPSPRRWPGRGLRLTSPSWLQTDGSDQAGYLTEDGPGGTGFDTDYTLLQASQVARLWLLTRDWKALRLLNVLWGQLAPRVGPDVKIDMSEGVRHPYTGARWDVVSSVIPVLGAVGRADVQQYQAGWWLRALDPAQYPTTMQPGAFYSTGMDLGTALLARAGWKPQP